MGEEWVVEWGKCVSLSRDLIFILIIGAVAMLGRAETFCGETTALFSRDVFYYLSNCPATFSSIIQPAL